MPFSSLSGSVSSVFDSRSDSKTPIPIVYPVQ